MTRLSRSLLLALLFAASLPAHAAKTVAGSDGFPEPRVVTIDMNLPEQIMSIQEQAAIQNKRNQPRHDESGRIQYMVDLVPNVTDGHSDYTSVDERLGDWHKPAMYSVTHAFEARYNFKATGMISWVGKGFIAYLTPAQAEALKRDPQVERITEEHDVAFSAVWSHQDYPSGGSEIVPWNIAAVGGNKLSGGGSVHAYVLDSGVGKHQDLPNVIQRVSFNDAARNAVPVVGCLPHSTHVAGIISAARNNVGVVGVDSSVPVVSVSVSDSADTTDNCGNGHSEPYIGFGLDKIKSLISANRRVGVVNISLNGQYASNKIFASGTPLGLKLVDLATPAAGYPGAFIVQSAGNQWESACDHAYNAPSVNDGIMVVGAVDINGQPVVPLNKMDGFRNQELFGIGATDPGSNYGSCVDIWAPGNVIYSTWADSVLQSGNPTYTHYGHLSSTSMAAPHVTGVAAWLAESQNLTTPAAIEAAVRNYAYSSGAKDPSTGLPLLMANAEGAHYIAQPTVEFAINGTVNGNLNTNSASPFKLSYESVGATKCNLTSYLNNAVWYPAGTPSNLMTFDWGTVQLAPGIYRWAVNCYSAANTMSSAQATATVTVPPPVPTAAFSFNNVPQPNVATTGSTPGPSTPIKDIPYGTQPFNFLFNSTGTTGCQLNAYYATASNAFWTLWYTAPPMPTYYSWPPVTLASNYYWWQLSCTGAGGTVYTNFMAHVH